MCMANIVDKFQMVSINSDWETTVTGNYNAAQQTTIV